MKRSPLKRYSAREIPKLKRKLWKEFADYIKCRDNYTCFTCGRKVTGYECNAGHFIPKAAGGLALYFHEDNVHVQCSKCNCFLEGNHYEYGKRLGEKMVKELYKLQHVVMKWSVQDYLNKIEHYKNLNEQCRNNSQRT